MAIFTKKFSGTARGADQERNQIKYDNFGRMYGKSSIYEAHYTELEAKHAKNDEKASKWGEFVQSDHEATTSLSVRDWVSEMESDRKKDKIDPNQAFKRRKRERAAPTIGEIIDSLK